MELNDELRGIKAFLPHKASVKLDELYVLLISKNSWSIRKLLDSMGQLMLATDLDTFKGQLFGMRTVQLDTSIASNCEALKFLTQDLKLKIEPQKKYLIVSVYDFTKVLELSSDSTLTEAKALQEVLNAKFVNESIPWGSNLQYNSD